jgi:asparagine synthase (glutamine-hydrolysing)
MCGFAGILAGRGPAPALEALARMAASLQHRGPDEFGVYRDAHVGLAHARLSIIDLTSGQQPLANEDHSLWVVFNGEIFNFVELRQELEALGHRFRTRSDTEVIVHAYEAWGNAAFARFNGQFAIALWDANSQRLALARDAVGICPLHFMYDGNRLIFASEAKAIFAADPEIPRALDPVGIAETFTFWSIVPPQSVFRNVEEVRPGHVRTYANGTVTDEAFVTPRYAAADDESDLTIEDAAEQVLALLEDATRLRLLRSDVPVGSYLSGGLDSSLVAALGRRTNGQSFKTFSLRFEDAEYDESEFQRTMVEFLGSEHAEVVVSRDDIARIFPRVIWHTERPILRTAPAPMMLLSGLVRSSGIKVVLTGEGADEMFAGYDLFREAKVRRFWARQPASTMRPRLLERLYPYLARSPVSQPALARNFFGRGLERAGEPDFAHEPRWRSAAALQRFFSREQRESAAGVDVTARFLSTLPAEFSSWPVLSRDQYIEIRTLLAGYLLSSQGDRMLMGSSVEGRFPFLDPRVIELANRLPPSFKLRVLDEKHLLKRAAAKLLPAQILARRKQPYRAPDAACFVAPSAPDWVADVVSEAAVARAGIFDPRAVSQLFKKCREHKMEQFSNADNMAVIGVLSTQLLHRQFVETPPSPSSEREVRWTTQVDRLHQTRQEE